MGSNFENWLFFCTGEPFFFIIMFRKIWVILDLFCSEMARPIKDDTKMVLSRELIYRDHQMALFSVFNFYKIIQL